jgi:hypothetical protein
MNLEDKIQVIYIAGGGHSGSTILSVILGTSPEIFSAGELKFYNEHKVLDHPMWEYIENVCMCGKDANDCPFWHRVKERSNRELVIFHYSNIREKVATAIKILWPFYHIQKTAKAYDDYRLIKNVYLEAVMEKPTTRYILDSSKSVARLMHLQSHPLLDVKVIFLVRDGRAYANSYAKVYKKGFLRWIIQWVLNNILTMVYLKREKTDYYYLSYNALCNQSSKELTAIGKKFNVHIPENFVEMVKTQKYHMRAGNPSRSAIEKFSGLELDENWRQEMSKVKFVISSTLLYLFNRWWVH